MYNKYMFPLQIFLILEKTNINLYSSKKLPPNVYNIFLNQKWASTAALILKYELFLNTSSLIENTATDTSYFNNIDNKFFFFYKKFNSIVQYNFYVHNLKLRILINFILKKSNNSINSLDRIFPNANWIERETSEMYGIIYNNKKDHRKLLLDYSSFENPLKKDFPVEGNKQVFFSFFENQVIIQNNKKIEI